MDMARAKETQPAATGRTSPVRTAAAKPAAQAPLGAIERACRFIEARVAVDPAKLADPAFNLKKAVGV